MLHTLRVLIADQDPTTAFCLQAQLGNLGHKVIAQATDGAGAVALAQQLCPDLVVMDVELPGLDGLEAGSRIGRQGLCPVILLGAGHEADLLQRAHSLAIQAYLVKPVSERDLGPAIELALDHFHQVRQLQSEVTQLRRILDIRATLRGAIQYLAAHDRCSPVEAWGRIQQEARAKRAGLDEVAQAIIGGGTVQYHYDVPI